MSTDRELLELAAKAAGIDGFFVDAGLNAGSNAFPKVWNPLTDDGDALRLAVKLAISITPYPIYEHPKHSVIAWRKSLDDSRGEVAEVYGGDQYAATRRAIVRAAAAIAKADGGAEG